MLLLDATAATPATRPDGICEQVTQFCFTPELSFFQGSKCLMRCCTREPYVVVSAGLKISNRRYQTGV